MGDRPRSITLPGPYHIQQSASPLSSLILGLPKSGLSSLYESKWPLTIYRLPSLALCKIAEQPQKPEP